ncbi:hypothetical protein M514_12539 [Trichuris suis]|uniref:Uncharacterized protein n=2 Tax=Trichuris suis TaxID=68888 RepID=A0A085MX92_9BILA|nr:hypothetical protein M514_12539 [Trichuris suis]
MAVNGNGSIPVDTSNASASLLSDAVATSKLILAVAAVILNVAMIIFILAKGKLLRGDKFSADSQGNAAANP